MQSNVSKAWTYLDEHIKAHQYKRGEFKGDAPADYTRRGKSHFRVVKLGDDRAVRLHNTNIIRVKPDGHLILDCAGWASHMTTKAAIEFGLALCRVRGHISNVPKFGLSQLCFKSNAPGQGAVIYYDGMELDEMGRVLSPLKPFQRKRVNRTETAEFHADITESGFKDMFKVLHATCAEEERHEPLGVEAHKAVRYAHHANVWKALVARTAWVYGSYNWSTKRSTYVKRTAKETWDVIMHNCKSGMYEIVTTDVTVV